VLKEQLGRRIAELRKKNKLTQEALAELTDYSVEFISFIERGINGPSIDGIERISKALKVSVQELFTFED